MNSYQDVLKRLVAYRKRLGMTQKEIAVEIEVSQEQYSYLENGIIKITDKNLQGFLKNGWDIDYIITGTESWNQKTELDDIFTRFEREEEKNLAMKLLAEVMLMKEERRSSEKENIPAANMKELLEAVVQSWNQFSMCLFVREQLQLSQIAMAERIGVGIKKYREIERQTRYPDAEILLSFYNMSGYQPILFLDVQDRRMLIIKLFWHLLGADERQIMTEFIKYVKTVIEKT